MKVLIFGSSGFIGTALKKKLIERGDTVFRAVRDPKKLSSDAIFFDPENNELNPKDLEGFDAVINLSGENIADGRWTDAKKKLIRKSRVKGTRLISSALAQLDHKPKVFISASAIGYYGNRGEVVLTEDSGPVDEFLSVVSREWESATIPASDHGIRVVLPRIGVVLSGEGGALKKMLPPFKLGLGGVIGDGKQYMSWVSLDDVVAAIIFSMTHEAVVGAVNVVSPHPVTNRVFTKALGGVLKRPTYFKVPAFLARVVFGEMADALLLGSARVLPVKLQKSGFVFKDRDLSDTLRKLI